jgi:hypothetical protein
VGAISITCVVSITSHSISSKKGNENTGNL